MNSYELCRALQQKAIDGYADTHTLLLTIEVVPYPDPGWSLFLSGYETLTVLQADSRHYTPCGVSTISESEKALFALSHKDFEWVEYASYKTHLDKSKGILTSLPFLAWSSHEWTEGDCYRIYRSEFHSGLFLPKLIKAGEAVSTCIHPGVNTIEDAKMVCVMHYEENKSQ